MSCRRTLIMTMTALAAVGSALTAEGRKTRALPRYTRHTSRYSVSPALRETTLDCDNQEKAEWEQFLHVREPQEIISELDSLYTHPKTFNPLQGPKMFSGYLPPPEQGIRFTPTLDYASLIKADSVPRQEPLWEFNEGLRTADNLQWLQYQYIIRNPQTVDVLTWLLPPPPGMPRDEFSFENYIRRLRLPSVDGKGVGLTARKINRINWLHTFNGDIQFSQAYLSKNWYQGGNDYLALLINAYWNVQLNQAYHPNLLFQNTVSYKLGLNSASQDEYHKYSISEDLFQWNMNFGLKAHSKWYYSLTTQFKTQLLHSYAENSQTRTAAFMSPGEFNVGLGMTYSTVNKFKTFQMNLAISPLSYNLKTCLDHEVDPTQFGITARHVARNEIGSSAEFTMQLDLSSHISYRTRFFVFTDYRNYAQDWENTLTFSINRFLSTQIYAHLRYDTSGTSIDHWGHWMLKEILSFGFSYAFSTK